MLKTRLSRRCTAMYKAVGLFLLFAVLLSNAPERASSLNSVLKLNTIVVTAVVPHSCSKADISDNQSEGPRSQSELALMEDRTLLLLNDNGLSGQMPLSNNQNRQYSLSYKVGKQNNSHLAGLTLQQLSVLRI